MEIENANSLLGVRTALQEERAKINERIESTEKRLYRGGWRGDMNEVEPMPNVAQRITDGPKTTGVCGLGNAVGRMPAPVLESFADHARRFLMKGMRGLNPDDSARLKPILKAAALLAEAVAEQVPGSYQFTCLKMVHELTVIAAEGIARNGDSLV